MRPANAVLLAAAVMLAVGSFGSRRTFDPATSAEAAESTQILIRTTTLDGRPAESGTHRFAFVPRGPGELADAGEFGDLVADDDAARERALADLPYVPGRLIVRLTGDAGRRSEEARRARRAGAGEFGIDALDALCRRYAVRSIERPFVRRRTRPVTSNNQRAARAPAGAVAPSFEFVYVLELSRYLDMHAVARSFAAEAEVVWAEPDGKVELFSVTNDPFLLSVGSWGQPFADLWALDRIDAPSAWDVTRGAGVLVAVVDSGIDATHPDLIGRLWTNPGEIADNALDDDGNGYVDDTVGWDTSDDDNDPTDENGHGTHVAGTIGAAGNNGIGIVGVAYESTLMAVKAFSPFGTGDFIDVAEAVLYATDNGADVINASWGASFESELITDAVDAAVAAGVVFVAAAGNSAADVATFHPASHPGAIAVSAFDSTDTIAFFSNFGAGIDVAAPGGGDSEPANKLDPFRSVFSLKAAMAQNSIAPPGLVIDDLYLRQGGTSMAAPHVSATVALVLANQPSLTVEQVRQVLRASADDVARPGFDTASGYGRINAGRAVTVPAPPAVTVVAPASEAMIRGNTIEIAGTAAGGGLTSYTVEYGAGDEPTAWTTIAGPVPSEITDGTLAAWDVSAVADGRYTVRVRADNGSGFVFEDRVQITLDRIDISEPASYTIHRGGGPLEIRGTAYAPGFGAYSVEYRLIGPDLVEGPWTNAGMAETAAGTAPVFEDVLAVFDTSVLPAARDMDFRLTVTGSNGAREETYYHVVVDPTIRAGWPRSIPVQTQFHVMEGGMNVADLDGDGTKEILAAYGDLVYVWRHDGTDFPGWPQSVEDGDEETFEFVDRSPAAADLDNDGDLEIVVADGRDIHVWHHDGTAMAGWPIHYRLPDEFYDFEPTDDVTLVDLDGDGVRDILFPWHHGVGAVRTDGTLLPGWPVLFETNLLSRAMESSIAVGDVTGDGSPEVAFVRRHCCSSSGLQSLYVYDASGTLLDRFPRRVSRRRVDDNFPILVDIDGNGILDIVTNNSKARKVTAFDWRAKPRKLRTRVPAPRVRLLTTFGRKRFDSQQEPLSAADITGDGRAEIFVGTEWPQPHVRCGGGRCTWVFLEPPWNGTSVLQAVSATVRELPGWPQVFEFSRGDNAHGAGSPAIGDLDGDGGQDVVSATGICWVAPEFAYHRCYPVHAFHADGTVLAGFPKPAANPGPSAGVMPAIGDLDGDGLKEVVWADWAGNVVVYDVPGTPGPESIQWSGFRGNAAHTGALE